MEIPVQTMSELVFGEPTDDAVPELLEEVDETEVRRTMGQDL